MMNNIPDKYITERKSNFKILPSLRFYSRLAKIVFRASSLAKKGRFDSQKYLAANWDIIHSLEKSGVQFEVDGIENVKKLDGPALFIGNHVSSLETMCLAAFIEPFRSVLFIMKRELLDYPVFGHVTRATEPIAVGRENPREDLQHVLEEGKKKLSEGRSIVIFPQKTRTKYFDPTKFNTLGIKLAQRSGAYVVPFALVTDAWGNGKLIKDFGKIDPDKKVLISFGEPFKVQNPAESHKKVLEFIESKLREWGREELIIQPK